MNLPRSGVKDFPVVLRQLEPGVGLHHRHTRTIHRNQLAIRRQGLEAESIAKLADIKYVYNRSWSDGAKVFKVVSFYLFRYLSGKIGDIKEEMRHEVAHAMWLPLDEAPKKLS